MPLIEQIKLMKDLGINASDDKLKDLLVKADYNVERAINNFFESSLTQSPIRDTVNTVNSNGSNRKTTSSHVDLTTSANSSCSTSSNPPATMSETSWLIGRRVTLGYTLNSGVALRQSPLSFKFEGSLLNAGKPQTASNFFQVKTKKKTKFSAASLLFECSSGSGGGNTIKGRLSNLICSFLVPLIREDLVVVQGHVAYDIGQVGVFQDLPVSLQIVVRPRFFSSLQVEGKVNDTKTSSQCVQAASDMLIWLTEGESALIASRDCDRELQKVDSDTSITDPDVADEGVDVVGEEVVQDPALKGVMQELGGSNGGHLSKLGEPMISQPSCMTGIQMKRYQLAALRWMIDREAPASPSTLSHSSDRCEHVTEVSLPIEGVLHVPAFRNHQSVTMHELWTPLVALQVPTPAKDKSGQPIPPSRAMYYSHEDIAGIIEASGKSVRSCVNALLSRSDESSPGPLHCIWWNRYTQSLQAHPPALPMPCRGGILADEMGLGKTVMAVALVASECCTAPEGSIDGAYKKKSRTCTDVSGTLVVCPLSLMGQWVEEFKTRISPGRIRCVMHYGTERANAGNLSSFDVVITSYGVLTSEWRKGSASSTHSSLPHSSSILLGRQWKRVILDEAHSIRNQQTDVAKACCSVDAQRRWAITGTPIQNRVDDLFSLMKFLRHEPWDKWRWWHKTIAQPLANEDDKGMLVLRNILSTLMLRRTKRTIDPSTGRSIVDLPPRKVEVVFVDLEPTERSFYDAFAKRSSVLSASIIRKASGGGVMKSSKGVGGYAALFTLLMRLRQACDHPVLVLRGITKSTKNPVSLAQNTLATATNNPLNDSDTLSRVSSKLLQSGDSSKSQYLEDMMKRLERSWRQETGDTSAVESSEDSLDEECAVCLEMMEPQQCCITPCGHMLCWECGQLTVERNSSCPMCMKPMRVGDLIPLSDHLQLRTNVDKKSSVQTKGTQSAEDILNRMDWAVSSKINVLLERLEEVLFSERVDDRHGVRPPTNHSLDYDNGNKVVIFSQWTSMLDLVGHSIQERFGWSAETDNCNENTNRNNKRLKTSSGYSPGGDSRGIQQVRFDGSMSQQQRLSALQAFNEDPAVRVLLISLKYSYHTAS